MRQHRQNSRRRSCEAFRTLRDFPGGPDAAEIALRAGGFAVQLRTIGWTVSKKSRDRLIAMRSIASSVRPSSRGVPLP